tara:strand:- start:942 stop:1157 length:216 start_codon:yes stop_codon:yes gene_type:complete
MHNQLDMEKLELTRDEIILVIQSVQRTIIHLEKWQEGATEILRKHRLLLGTLLAMEQQLFSNKINQIESYK